MGNGVQEEKEMIKDEEYISIRKKKKKDMEREGKGGTAGNTQKINEG